MRLAILTDIHGNREAFSAVLADVEQRAIDRIVLLGDIVGYGPDPEWCADKAAALVEAGAIAVQGNHDNAVGDRAESMGKVAAAAMDWTRPRMNEAQRKFLAALPLTQELGDILFVHASANDPGDWIYVTGAQRAMGSFRVCTSRLIFCGHVHVPALISCGLTGQVQEHEFRIGAAVPLIRSRRWIVVVGSVGQPRDRSPEAAYAILDTGTNELSFRRVAYDVAATAAKIRASGLPEVLATRLLKGE